MGIAVLIVDEREALERAFTLLPDDFPLILAARGLPQRLERALMLSWMRIERTLVTDVTTLPEAVIMYIAQQLDLTADLLAGYRSHQQTRTAAAQAIRAHLGVRPFARTDRARLTTASRTPDARPRSRKRRTTGWCAKGFSAPPGPTRFISFSWSGGAMNATRFLTAEER